MAEDDHHHDHDDHAGHDAGGSHGHDDHHGHDGVDRRDAENGAGHGHSHATLAFDGTDAGIRSLRVGLIGLALTSAAQFAIQAFSPSAGLLADALHNSGDVLTTGALWIAFAATRRAANRRYSFGYSRFEDITGLVIVLAIFISAGVAAYESIDRLVNGQEFHRIGLAMAGAVIGVVGNEVVGRYKVVVGRRINSVALVAEGQHSRIDGLASAAALLGLIGVAAGLDVADPLAGLALSLVIVWVGIDTGREVVSRLADRVDPAVLDRAERAANAVPEVSGVHDVRARWAGRNLYVLLHVSVPGQMSLTDAHGVAEQVRHAVFHDVSGVVQVDVHLDPDEEFDEAHSETAHHSKPPL